MADPLVNMVMIGIISILVIMLILVLLYHWLFGSKKGSSEEKVEVIEQTPNQDEETEPVKTTYTYGEE